MKKSVDKKSVERKSVKGLCRRKVLMVKILVGGKSVDPIFFTDKILVD